jgi:hypothetical protein
MCAVGGASNLNNLNATKQPPSGAECNRERGYSPTPLPANFLTGTFLTLTYQENASERPIVVFSTPGLYLSGTQFEFRQNTSYSERVFM